MKQLKSLILFLFTASAMFAQQPNDCVNAITICGNGNFSSNSSGIGTIQEVSGCSGMEHNSIWLKINIVNGGTLGFNLIPSNTALVVDYDFWVYGPNKPCNNLGSPIRCCTTNPLMAGLTSNVTGMATLPLATTAGPGANGNGFVRWLTVNPGESYYIAIDRPVGDGGFQLQWTGTAMDTGGAFPVPPSANSLGEIRSCSNTPNVGIFDLNSLRPQINSDLVNNTITFHANIADATDGTSPLPNLYSPFPNPQTIYARVRNNVSGCFTITSFQLKVYSVPNASISTSTPTICPNNNGVVTFNGTPNAIIEYNVNNGTTQTATLDASGTFQITTPLSVTTTYKLILVKVVDNTNATLCDQALNSSVTITVSSPPAPAISNNGTICSDGVETLTFTGLANASITYTINGGTTQTVVLDNTGQQQVSLSGLTPGNYTVLITSITDSNPPNCTTNVNITSTFTVQPALFADIAVNNSAICSGTSVVVTFTGTPNANVTYTVNAGTNQTIILNGSGTASITTSALTSNQTYQLVNAFTTAPNCTKLENDSVTITIIAQPTVTSFTGTTAICNGSSTNLNFVGTPNATVTYFDGATNQSVLLDGSGNGIVAVSPTATTTYSLVGIAIATTPVCTNSASGNVTITVSNAPQAGTDGSTSVCETSSVAINLFGLITGEQAGGVWTRTGGIGGTFNAAAGTFTPAVGSTTSAFTYTLTGTAPCVSDFSIANITITAQPIAGTDSGSLLYCETDSSLIDLFGLISGEQPGGVWTRNSGTGGTFNAAAGTFALAAGVTNSTFTYTILGTAPCVDDSSQVSIIIAQQPNAGTDGNTSVCAGSTTAIDLFSLISGEQLGGTWVRSTGTGGTFNAAAGTFTPAIGTSATSTFTYTLTGTIPCVNDSSLATINVTPQPIAGNDGNTTICDNNLATIDLFSLITGEQLGGTWIRTNGTGGTFDPISGTFTPAVGATTSTFTYTLTAAAPCINDSSVATVNINPIPTNITISGGMGTCAGVPVNLMITGTPGTTITWTGTPSSFLIGNSGSYPISVSPATTTTYTLLTASNGCTIPVVGQSTTVTISTTPQFVNQISDFTICNGDSYDIASQLTSTVPGTTYAWSASTNNVTLPLLSGNETNINQVTNLINTLENGTITVIVEPKVGNCSGNYQEIIITVNPKPEIESVTVEDNILCNGQTAEIDVDSELTGTTYAWQVNAANTNNVQISGGITSGTSTSGSINLQLNLINPLQVGTISFNITSSNGSCVGESQVNVATITVNPIPGTPIGLPISEICSGEVTNLQISENLNIAGTNLEWEVIDSQNVTGFTPTGSGTAPIQIQDTLLNTSDVQGFVKYRVKTVLGTMGQECEGSFTDFTVLVNPLPKPNLIDGHICVNATTGATYQSYILNTQLNNPNFTYDWYVYNTVTSTFDPIAGATGSTYEVTAAGEYQVIVTNQVTGCFDTDSATVIEVFPATDFTYTVTDAFSNSATITVTVNPVGTGNLIYSLDGGAWQESNVFTGVEAGEHTILVSDEEGCTNMSEVVMVVDFPKYFTPNGDGFNDTWNIVGLNALHNAKIYIFDRYGKLIKQINPLGEGWDGKYNGQDISSSDYWFSVDYTENEQQKQFKSHFALKR